KCNMDRKETLQDYYVEDSAEQSIKETECLINHIRSLVPRSQDAAVGTAPEPLVQPILSPRFALACTRECLSGLRDLAHRYNHEHPDEPRIRIQTHIAENRKEVKEVLKYYPEAESYTQVYDNYGLLRDTTILGHSVHLSPGEVLLIKKRDAGISHCPTSNFYLSSGIAPVGEYLDAGVKVGLGTDVSGGYAVSMLNVIQNASIASKILAIEAGLPEPEEVPSFANRQLPIPTLFYLATLGGARVCNLSEKIGSFSEGKSFDALVVSVLDDTGATGVWGMEAKSDGDYKKKREKLEENLERFMFCGDDRNILKVYVQGCLVGGRSFVPQ
ncbi:putative guanine deaminase, partial [Leucoagaricus sp. SymC.cos]